MQETAVRGNAVTNGNSNDITRNQLIGLDLLGDAVANDLGFVCGVFL